MDPINSIQPIKQTTLTSLEQTKSKSSEQNDFGQLFSNAINQLVQKEQIANQTVMKLASGEDIEIHQAVMAMEEADISFQLALQIRNKVVEAYQEVMRMQL
jgi:flagellar hook-basal body complex protein FliE